MWKEHTNVTGRGTDPSAVAISARGGKIEVTLGRGALEQLPWFRGGERVAVMVGQGSEAGRMRIVRGDTHRLLSRVPAAGRSLDKLPPVVLRMDALETMRPGAAHEPEPCLHSISRGLLEVTLPSWAAPPVPAVAPPTPFQMGGFAPHEDRDRAASLAARGVR